MPLGHGCSQWGMAQHRAPLTRVIWNTSQSGTLHRSQIRQINRRKNEERRVKHHNAFYHQQLREEIVVRFSKLVRPLLFQRAPNARLLTQIPFGYLSQVLNCSCDANLVMCATDLSIGAPHVYKLSRAKPRQCHRLVVLTYLAHRLSDSAFSFSSSSIWMRPSPNCTFSVVESLTTGRPWRVTCAYAPSRSRISFFSFDTSTLKSQKITENTACFGPER